MMYMVRKQLYLTEAQDAALKRRSADLGISEAEFVRRALDNALGDRPLRRRRPDQATALAALLQTWSSGRWVLEGDLDRDSLYQDRLDQLDPASKTHGP